MKGDEGMREIKFRAWDKYTEEMWNVETLHIEDEYVDLFKTNIYEKPLENPWAKISDVILMQYTGLKDKNDVEIYEGDIVEAYFWNDKLKPVKEKGFIGFKSGSFIFNFGDGTWEYLDGYDDIFIVGNIYENKNLLNKGVE